MPVVFCYSRKLQWTGHVAMMEETRNAYKILVGKPLGEHPHGLRGKL
jgi:hypothetical protein